MPESQTQYFDRLVAPHLETLFRVAYRLVRNTADAEDLVQDTCVTACASLAALAAADSSLHWLLRVQQNRFIDGERRRKRSPVLSHEDGGAEPTASEYPDPELLLQQIQNEQLLDQAFQQLDEFQRTLLSLRAEGYDLPEIESITGIDRKALSVRLHRARLSLSRKLADQTRILPMSRKAGSRP
jgi:RNA polymerase sigma-70 factor (ECF subfamily)